MRMNREPRLIGRFNYLQYKKDIYTLVFVPYVGSSCQVVARNLSFEEVKELMDDLNSVFDAFKEEHLDQ